MRYIDADLLKVEFPHNEDWDYPVNTNSYVCEMIDIQPTVDVRENVKGEWEVIDYAEPRRYGCSICRIFVWHPTNYCPNCGADMRGEEDDS